MYPFDAKNLICREIAFLLNQNGVKQRQQNIQYTNQHFSRDRLRLNDFVDNQPVTTTSYQHPAQSINEIYRTKIAFDIYLRFFAFFDWIFGGCLVFGARSAFQFPLPRIR